MAGKQLIDGKKKKKKTNILIKYYNLKFWSIKSKIESMQYLKDKKFWFTPSYHILLTLLVCSPVHMHRYNWK